MQGRETLAHLRAAQQRRLEANNQVSTGIRVRDPSDAPADAAQIVRSQSSLRAIGQLSSNLGDAGAELRAVDGFLFRTTEALTRARELAAQAASDTLDAAGREAIGEEIQGVFRHIVTLANATHNGRFVFAGGADAAPPFVIDESSPNGVVYAGDSAGRALRFPDGRPAQFSLPGNAVFLTPEAALGAGRTAGTLGGMPSPPVGVGLAFSGDLDTVLSVDLEGFFVAAAPPSGASAGDTVAVTFVSEDGAVNETITTPALAGGEDASALAALLNAEAAANPNLDGLVSFSDEGGRLKIVLSDTARQGFGFTSTSTGAIVSGLEPGGTLGGYSAEEIAAALTEAAAGNAELAAAQVRFEAVNGELRVSGNVDFTLTVVDFDRGTGFASGLEGTHVVGGAGSANVLGTLHELAAALAANDRDAVAEGVHRLGRAIEHIGRAHGFYGATLRQVDVTLGLLGDLDVISRQQLSGRQDADLAEAISELVNATNAERFALEVAARQQPTLLDLLA